MSDRAYYAEDVVFKKRMRGNGMHMRIADATELVHQYLGQEWTVRRTHTSNAGSGSWCYTSRKLITLAPDAGLPLVLHEIAHGLTPGAHHGLAWQRAYIELVRKEMGDSWAVRLRNSFVRNKCKGWKTLRLDRG